jgi:hypothetical protein
MLTQSQERQVASFESTLESWTLQTTGPPIRSSNEPPWNRLRAALDAADGVAVLGMRQLRVDTGCWRAGTVEAAPARKWWPTPWNQLEAGMAIMAGVPTLILCQEGVAGGVFDPHMWADNVYGADFNDFPDHLSVRRWTVAVTKQSIVRSGNPGLRDSR